MILVTHCVVVALFHLATISHGRILPPAAQIPLAHSTSLNWENCTQEPLEGLQCANLSVPLDWSAPDVAGGREHINLLVTKLPATGKPHEKIGSLYYNPGGPGIPTSLIMANFARSNSSKGGDMFFTPISDVLRQRFDIIGPDPRGVGFSTPLRCDGHAYNRRVSRTPRTEEEFDALLQYNKALGESCREISGRIIDFMDTNSVARDFEALRIAMGDEHFNYLGTSYGTQIGMAYAELFGQRIRAMVLDGMLDHSQRENDMFVTESSAFERELLRFFDWCNTTSECVLRREDVSQLFVDLIERAAETPIPAPECGKKCRKNVTAFELINGIDGDLSFLRKNPPLGMKGGWPLLSKHLKAALEGDASAFSEFLWYDEISDLQANSLWAERGTACQDWFHDSASVADVVYKSQLGKVIAPHTQGICQSYKIATECLGWPAKLTNPPYWGGIRDNPNPILLVNSFHDPSTSYVWAVSTHNQINNSVLLSRNGDGHVSIHLGGEASKAIDVYLIDLKVPPPNTVVDT